MAVEFRHRKICYKTEVYTEVFYKKERIGTAVLDFIVDGRLVVELKATAKISGGHVSQAGAYMRESGLPAGLVVTFPTPSAPSPQFEDLRLPT